MTARSANIEPAMTFAKATPGCRFNRAGHGLRAVAILAAGLVAIFQCTAIASAQNPSPASQVPLPTPAPATAQSTGDKPEHAKQPPPDVWSASEIADARRVCTNALKSMSAEITEMPSIKKGLCGSPAPVRLISIGKTNPVKFVPAPTINCGMLVPLKRWIDEGLQPAAARILDAQVSTISIISSYSCRTRYSRKGAKMSEHAFANALDISGFRLTDGRRVSVLKDWGLTRRDIAKAIAAAKAEKLKQDKTDPSVAPLSSTQPRAERRSPISPNTSGRRTSAPIKPVLPEVQIDARSSTKLARDRAREQRALERRQRRKLRRAARAAGIRVPLDRPTRRRNRLNEDPQPGAFGVRVPQAVPPPLPVRRPLRRAVRRRVNLIQSDPPTAKTRQQSLPDPQNKFKPPYQLGGPKPATSAPRSIFLRAIHKAACRIFGTTLGPEANEAHRNHFHFDMFPRRRRGYCE